MTVAANTAPLAAKAQPTPLPPPPTIEATGLHPDLLHQLMSGRVDKNTVCAEVMERKVSTVSTHAGSGELPRIFERGEVAIVVDDDRQVLGILTKMDLIEMLAAKPR